MHTYVFYYRVHIAQIGKMEVKDYSLQGAMTQLLAKEPGAYNVRLLSSKGA